MWGRVEVCRDCALAKGGLLGRRKVAVHDLGGDFSPANLKRLAASGIMDANALFLPAGKLSIAETKKREHANVLSVHPD
jgi:hypothetical protein